MITYKAKAEERIEIGYVTKASPEAVVEWLKDNWKEPEKSIYGDMWDRDDDGSCRAEKERLSATAWLGH